ncbi:MAG TPA: phage protein Gp36 family protein [Polyangiaceae bacterium]|nr:phage protein Gp36 family protein [Polyangiaceae bacterium]
MAYATVDDLGGYVGTDMVAAYEAKEGTGSAQKALDEASGRIDSYLSRFTLPPAGPVPDLVRACKNIAGYDVMTSIGYANNGADAHFRLRFLDEIRWLEQVASGRLTPPGLETPLPPAPSPFAGVGTFVVSDKPRGW